MHFPGFTDFTSLQNEHLRVQVRPGQGANLCSLLNRHTGQEWLLPGGEAGPALRGEDFGAIAPGGFDECFPTIAAGPHPDAPVRWPDHGELWNRPWSVEPSAEGLCTRILGRAWPYVFTRQVGLEGASLHFEYTLENQAERPFHHLWSAHPLLQVTPGMKVLLPRAVRQVQVDNASNPALGRPGAWRAWPELLPGLDCSIVQPPDAGLAVKLYVQDAPEGPYGILDPRSGGALTFEWNRSELPHLGLWLCFGGWPSDGRPGQLTVALEPCSGMPDRLQDASDRGLCPVLGAGEKKTWSLRLRVHDTWEPETGEPS